MLAECIGRDDRALRRAKLARKIVGAIRSLRLVEIEARVGRVCAMPVEGRERVSRLACLRLRVGEAERVAQIVGPSPLEVRIDLDRSWPGERVGRRVGVEQQPLLLG